MSQLTADQKLDLVLQEITSVKQLQLDIKHLVTRVATLETKVQAQDDVIKRHEETIKSLSTEVTSLKEKTNLQEQLQKGDAIRLFNFPGSNDETGLSSKVYDKILKPILQAAKSKGDLSSVPKLNDLIDDCFRVGRFSPGANKPPPPIIIKFISLDARLAILKNKRTNTPSPTEGEKAIGIKRYVLAEDLTTPTYRKLQELLKDDRVDKAWTIGGEIWYVTPGENVRPK